jgi:energy-coupling factor transporter ATP-binding protein EcfA2
MKNHPHLHLLINLFENDDQPFRKVHRMIDLFESILKFHTAIIFSEYFRNNKISDKIKILLIENLRVPSLGIWQMLSRTFFNEIPRDNYNWIIKDFTEGFNHLSKYCDNNNEVKENIITFRNNYGHGSTPDDITCESDIQEYFPILKDFLNFNWLQNTSLIIENDKVWIQFDNDKLCLYPIMIFDKDKLKSPVAFFNEKKKNKINYLNYPFFNVFPLLDENLYEFNNTLPLDNWRTELGIQVFSQKILELTDSYIGRENEIDILRNFVIERNSGYLLITGNPGVGKSALIAKFCQVLNNEYEFENCHQITYFIRFDVEPVLFLKYLNSSINEIMKSGIKMKDNDTNLINLKNILINNFRNWSIIKENKKLIFLIDGIDEGINNNLVNSLFYENFDGILFIYGSRNSGHVSIERLFSNLNPTFTLRLNLGGLSKSDIRAMIYKVSNKYAIERESTWINLIEERSQGNPLYLNLLCNDLFYGIKKTNDLEGLPTNLGEFFREILNRISRISDASETVKALYSFVASKDSLTFGHIKYINNFNVDIIISIENNLKEVLIDNPLTSHKDYQLFHESFREFLKEEMNYEVHESIGRILNFCLDWVKYDGQFEQEYTLKFFANHLVEYESETNLELLHNLLVNNEYKIKQIQVLKSYQATKNLLIIGILNLKDQKYALKRIEAICELIDINKEEYVVSYQILEYLKTDISIVVQRLNSFNGSSKQEKQNLFLIYMLCFVELTLLNGAEQINENEKIQLLLSSFNEQIPDDDSVIVWEDFFPESIILLIADQLKIRNLDYSILFNKTRRMDYAYWLDSIESFSDSQLDLLYDLARSNRINEEKVAFVLAKFGRFKQATELALNTTYPNQPIDKIALYYSDKDAEITNLFLQILPDRKNLPIVLNMIIYYELNNKFAEASELEEKISYHLEETTGNFAILAEFYFNKNNMEKCNFYFSKAFEYIKSEQTDFFKRVKIDKVIDSFIKINKVNILFDLIISIQDEFLRNISLENLLSKLVNNDNIEQAIKILNKIEDADLKFLRIIIFKLVEKNRLDEALKFLKDMNMSNNEYILTGITEILAQNGLIKEANNILNNLSTRNDDFNSFPLALAIGYIKNNNFDKAFECINNKVIWDYKLNEFLKNGLNIISKNNLNYFPEFISKFLRYSAFNSNYEKMKIAIEFINNQKSSRLANNDLNKDNNFILLEDSKEFSNLSSESQFDVLEKIERNGINQNQIESIFDFVLIYLINIDKYHHPSKDIVFKICSKFIEYGKESLVLHIINNYFDNPKDNYGKIEALLKFSNLLLTKVSEQIKRHFYLDILKIQNECAPIFQC